MHEMAAEMKKNEMLAARASAATTDDIRKGRATEVFNEQLAAELREARLAAAAAKGESTRLQDEKHAFFDQQMKTRCRRRQGVSPDPRQQIIWN